MSDGFAGTRSRCERRLRLTLASPVVAIALAVSACGGGGDGGAPAGSAGTLVTPPAAITPPTPPVPPSPPAPPPASAVAPGTVLTPTSDANFTTLAWDQGYTVAANGTSTTPEEIDPRDIFDFRFAASQQLHEVRFPGEANWLRLGASRPLIGGGSFFNLFELFSANSNDRFQLYLIQPGVANLTIALQYTSMGYWFADRRSAPGPRTYHSNGIFGYGVVTAEGSVPTTGTSQYEAFVYAPIGTGRAQLNVDFTNGRGFGSFEAGADYDGEGYVSTGQITISDLVYAPGSPVFRARLSTPTGKLFGTLEGRFTGPGGSELMTRWELRERDPVLSTDRVAHFGVFVGKRR